jgi:predicted alpha-1,6-mannanase (GH76 family)
MRAAPKFLLGIPALLLLTPSPPALPQDVSNADSVRQVQLAVDRLQEWYNPETGRWSTAGWWNAANALTALVDFSRAAHSSQYIPIIAQTYRLNVPGGFHPKVQRGFINQYYDDEGWWALAWIDAYDLTGDETYLQAARNIFRDMTGGWDNTCGGGIWWTKDRKYKNAIANELFLSVAAHLADRLGDDAQKKADAAWAEREWKWFQHSGLIEHDNLISDGLGAGCRDNHATKWTYNQGVILGGLSELSRIPGQSGVLRSARRIADAAITRLVDSNGILHDPCEPHCNGDASQFKGIFVRNLALLNARSPSQRYERFMTANADSLLMHSQTADHGFGIVWSGPPGVPSAVSQSSAIDALVAALDVRN